MKKCNVCLIFKEGDTFYSGSAVCKICYCAKVRKHRSLNDSVREYDRLRSSLPHRKLLREKVGKQWRKDNPEKYKAQTKLNNALRDGKITKPTNCSSCDKETRIYGHHEDYSKPLEVMWMCQRCHKLHHENIKEIK